MTEIRIKRRSPMWPWILGVLLLAVVAWMLIAMMTGREPATEQAVVQRPEEGAQRDQPTATSGRVPAALEDYSAFAAGAEKVSPGREHEYTAEGIRRLSTALAAHVEGNASGAETRERFQRFEQAADRLQRDPKSTEHSRMVRDVFTSAVDVFESGRVDAGDVSRLREIATSISPDGQLLEQTDRVKEFFSQSADALQRAARRS